jgi:hypothetical protein
MSCPVFSFEKILVENIVLGNMAIVAMCVFSMGTVVPCCVLRKHYVAIYTGLRLVGEVGNRIGNIHGVSAHTEKYSQEYNTGEDPVRRKLEK